jgi:hypothetical protein
MNFKYKIIEVHPEQHSIVVRFYTDKVSVEHLCLKDEDGNPRLNEDGEIARCKTDFNINLWEVPAITGEALHARIVECCPSILLALEEKILDSELDTSLTGMTSLIGEEVEGESTIPSSEL